MRIDEERSIPLLDIACHTHAMLVLPVCATVPPWHAITIHTTTLPRIKKMGFKLKKASKAFFELFMCQLFCVMRLFLRVCVRVCEVFQRRCGEANEVTRALMSACVMPLWQPTPSCVRACACCRPNATCTVYRSVHAAIFEF